MNWLEEWFTRSKNLVLHPEKFYEDVDAKKNYSYPIKFAVTSALLLSLVVFVVQEFQLAVGLDPMHAPQITGLESLVYLIMVGILGGTVGLLLQAGFIHVFVVLLGFRGYQKTTEAISYPTAINTFFGWIPIVNFFALIYTIYAEIKGIESFHGMSTKKAAVSVILGFVFLVLMVVILFSVIFILLNLEAVAPAVGVEGPLEAFI